MQIVNFGSINIDHLFRVPNIARPGETLASKSYQQVLGGKGANQSIALSKAGCKVRHVGAIGKQDDWILAEMAEAGVHIEHVQRVDEPTGSAIIQVDDCGENAILLHSGANHKLTRLQIDNALATMQQGDWVLLQNETTMADYIIHQSHQKRLKIALNPAPMTDAIRKLPLDLVDLLIVNEIETKDLANTQCIDEAAKKLKNAYPNTSLIITIGAKGVRYYDRDHQLEIPAKKVKAIDTTAAGDTFIGFCLAGLMKHQQIAAALKQGCLASAICVTRMGAAPSIPYLAELEQVS